MWCIPTITQEYKERMFDVLVLYEKPYNPKEPVVCFDESPVQLLSEIFNVIEAEPGKIRKRDSEYKRQGTANLFCAVEPLAGKHFLFVTDKRKGKDFAIALKKISKKYPNAKTIHLVLDNLNTHNKKSLQNYFGKKEGAKIWKKFTFHYTPKHGSWLNMAEIEIGLFKRQAIGKNRISTKKYLIGIANEWKKHANKKKATISWTFTQKKAKEKFKLY